MQRRHTEGTDAPLYTTGGKPGNYQLSIRKWGRKSRKPAENQVLIDVKLQAFPGILAVAVQRFQIIGPRFDGVGQSDPQRAVRSRRRNGGDRIGQLFPAGLVDEYHLRPTIRFR